MTNRWPADSPHAEPVMLKEFPAQEVSMAKGRPMQHIHKCAITASESKVYIQPLILVKLYSISVDDLQNATELCVELKTK